MRNFLSLLLSLVIFSQVSFAEFPGTFPSDLNTITIPGNLVVTGGLTKQENNTGTYEIVGGNATAVGSGAKFYGGAHATKAEDFELSAGAESIIAWDDSARALYIGGASATDILALKSKDILAGNGGSAADNIVYRTSQTDGSAVFSGGSSAILGAAVKVYGQLHATKAGDFEILNDNVVIVNYDASAATFGLSNGVKFNIGNQSTASAAAVATMTNAPTGAAGNPDLWLDVYSGGTKYVVPAWTP